MPPKKKPRTSGAGSARAKAAAALPPPPQVQALPVDVRNKDYLQELGEALADIMRVWPDITSCNPLPLTSNDPHMMTGTMAPFDAPQFDLKFATGGEAQTTYSCGINFFWMWAAKSVTPWIPLYKCRVDTLAEQLFATGPSPILEPFHVAITFDTSCNLPRGDLQRISPDEVGHAPIFALSRRIRQGAPASELLDWKRVLLSVPCVFQKYPNEDAKYAAATTLRNKMTGMGRAVTHTLRQTVCNVIGFKRHRETFSGPLSAAQVAEFYHTRVTMCNGCEELYKKSVIDSILTIHERVFKMPVCEDIIRRSEEEFGLEAAFNNIWKLQEVVYRCRTEKKITWLLTMLDDRLRAGMIENADIKIATLKAGGRSLSDVALIQMDLLSYLRGTWLDSMDLPSYMKAKLRDIFESHQSYRSQYAPFACMGPVDTTWLSGWPPVGTRVISFFESLVYNSNLQEDALLRAAVKHGKSPRDVLTWQPWANMLTEIQTELSRTALTDKVHVDLTGTADEDGATPGPRGKELLDIPDQDVETDAVEKLASGAASRFQQRMVCLNTDPGTQGGIFDLLAASPLGTVEAGEHGNVGIWLDCNVWGGRRCARRASQGAHSSGALG